MNKKLVAVVTTSAIAISIFAGGVASADKGRGGAALGSVLSDLVSKGTITQSQADAITKAQSEIKAGMKSAMQANRSELDSVITSTLGISLESLVTRLRAGETLSTIAGDKKPALITALSAQINKQIDAALASGKISAQQATAQKEKTTERVTNMVNNDRGIGGKANRPGAFGKGYKPANKVA